MEPIQILTNGQRAAIHSPSRRKLLSGAIQPDRLPLAVAYTRGSTHEQVLTLGHQSLETGRYAEYQRMDLRETFEDRGETSNTPFLQRPKVIEMLRFMAEHAIQQIIVTRIDRAFRSIADLNETITKMRKAGVVIHFCQQNINTDPANPMTSMLLQLLGVFAEFEKNVRSERQLEGFEQHRRSGYRSGVNAPYGWRAVMDGDRQTAERRQAYRLEPIPEEQEVLRQILLWAQTKPEAEIAALLNSAGIPTSKAGEKLRRKGRELKCSGKWTSKGVWSVISHARLAPQPSPVSHDPLPGRGECPMVSQYERFQSNGALLPLSVINIEDHD